MKIFLNYTLDFYEDSNDTSIAIPNRIKKTLEDSSLEMKNISSSSADNATDAADKVIVLPRKNVAIKVLELECLDQILYNYYIERSVENKVFYSINFDFLSVLFYNFSIW